MKDPKLLKELQNSRTPERPGWFWRRWWRVTLSLRCDYCCCRHFHRWHCPKTCCTSMTPWTVQNLEVATKRLLSNVAKRFWSLRWFFSSRGISSCALKSLLWTWAHPPQSLLAGDRITLYHLCVEIMSLLLSLCKDLWWKRSECEATKGSRPVVPFRGFLSVLPSAVRRPVALNICGFQREPEVPPVCLKRAGDSSLPANAASGNSRWSPPGSECWPDIYFTTKALRSCRKSTRCWWTIFFFSFLPASASIVGAGG